MTVDCDAAASDPPADNEPEQQMVATYRVHDPLPQLVTDSSAGVLPTTPPIQFQPDPPILPSTTGQYAEIDEFALRAPPETEAEGPYEGLDLTQVEQRPSVIVPAVYVPLTRELPDEDVPETQSSDLSRVDPSKRVRSLPTLTRLNSAQ